MAEKEAAESKLGYKTADVVEKKSWWVGGAALVGSLIVPSLLLITGWEGIQIVVAKEYKRRAKATEMKAGKGYSPTG